MQFTSVFERYKAQTRLLVRQLIFFRKNAEQIRKLRELGLVGDNKETVAALVAMEKLNAENIHRLNQDLTTVYLDFRPAVASACGTGMSCFVALSFLGVMEADGVCYDEYRQNQGYHIISGVDKFKALFEIFMTVGDAPTFRFNAREYDLTAEDIRDVTTLIEQDVLYRPLFALIAATAKKEFLPAGNWQTGLDLYEAEDYKLLGVYVRKMTDALGVRMAANVVGARRRDWTFGAAWLFGSYVTCELGVNEGAVSGLRAVFTLEQESISGLENLLSSFL